jgi:hypothetical protein
MAGLYEAAIEALATRTVDGRAVRPKIVASTATVRRARDQIQALFEKPHWIDPPTGEMHEVELFVAALGASNLTYAEALESQKVPQWIGAHTRACRLLQLRLAELLDPLPFQPQLSGPPRHPAHLADAHRERPANVPVAASLEPLEP